jgi:hypothetical protein
LSQACSEHYFGALSPAALSVHTLAVGRTPCGTLSSMSVLVLRVHAIERVAGDGLCAVRFPRRAVELDGHTCSFSVR